MISYDSVITRNSCLTIYRISIFSDKTFLNFKKRQNEQDWNQLHDMYDSILFALQKNWKTLEYFSGVSLFYLKQLTSPVKFPSINSVLKLITVWSPHSPEITAILNTDLGPEHSVAFSIL